MIGKKPFFNWISADGLIATARGAGGGLALWQRDVELQEKNKGTYLPSFFILFLHFILLEYIIQSALCKL